MIRNFNTNCQKIFVYKEYNSLINIYWSHIGRHVFPDAFHQNSVSKTELCIFIPEILFTTFSSYQRYTQKKYVRVFPDIKVRGKKSLESYRAPITRFRLRQKKVFECKRCPNTVQYITETCSALKSEVLIQFDLLTFGCLLLL